MLNTGAHSARDTGSRPVAWSTVASKAKKPGQLKYPSMLGSIPCVRERASAMPRWRNAISPRGTSVAKAAVPKSMSTSTAMSKIMTGRRAGPTASPRNATTKATFRIRTPTQNG